MSWVWIQLRRWRRVEICFEEVEGEIAASTRPGERETSISVSCNLLSRFVRQNSAIAAELSLRIKGETEIQRSPATMSMLPRVEGEEAERRKETMELFPYSSVFGVQDVVTASDASRRPPTSSVENGFTRANAPLLGACKHDEAMHLSPPQCLYTSAMLAKTDENDEAHIVLCRMLMGWLEAISAGSSRSSPSSDDYDSAVDNLVNPQWYIMWNKDMNTRILPHLPRKGRNLAGCKP
ncbi:uncharacterized protein LOC133902501 [Phragmites australis]|uniref:uncharacterized protein LOC133902501 n=1 Tax=Phragmites australis TaxID=29695 RepID=UPI002D79E913|nr:uncharacterized protein LOC133902501 [Phragmites australis]